MKFRGCNLPVPAALLVLTGLLSACGGADAIDAQRHIGTDAVVQIMKDNLLATDSLEEVADIDHSRLAQAAGSPMPPARVLLFSDPSMESQLIKLNPLAALDLPLRILALESRADRSSKVIYNSFDYLASRYQLDEAQTGELRRSYELDIAEVTKGLPADAATTFPSDRMQPDGIVTIPSPYGFEETLKRVNVAIDAQSDAIRFGAVDFQAAARGQAINLPPAYLILFGAPGPGGKAMAAAPTLGLDAFCQKFLVWQDADGNNFLSYNDLLALAERQGALKTIALRVINFRLKETFTDALAAEG